MYAASFDESNTSLDAPPGQTPEQCTILSVWKGEQDNGIPVVMSCWKPDAAELAEIQRTGRVWLILQGQTMPPAAVSGYHPWRQHRVDPGPQKQGV